jgi:aspartate-semialdehyde dehydrogenase
LADFHIPTVAIIGAETLLARDLRDLLTRLKPSPDIRLLSGEPGNAQVTHDEEGDAMLLVPFDQAAFDDVDVVFLAGTPESSRKALEIAGDAGPRLIDMSSALEDQPRARLRAPLLESHNDRAHDAIDVIAHPAAMMLAQFFARLNAKFPVERSVVEIFEPASERGKAGLAELQKQTVNLLSFKPLPKSVYDAQLGFNMLAAYGTESPYSLANSEERIDRHLATLLLISSGMTMPSLRLVQVPVFHGYSCSVWAEFAGSPSVTALEEALASAQIEVRCSDEEPPNSVGATGEEGIIAGGIRVDRNHPRAYWFWLVSDNLRTMAEAAVTVAREYL